jgi:hypothetical protein
VKQADFHEFKKTGHLALEVRWLKASDPRVCLSIDENLQQTPKSPKGNKGVCLQSESIKVYVLSSDDNEKSRVQQPLHIFFQR